ncbi:MAG: methyltransferase domain-containing protein [Lachnospiraceae bacterium]|nr:methyltransferase domain-containing protein [Lachnospiraceae bacterium]
MEAYTDFAQVYDELMDETPYEEWCDFLEMLLEKHGFSKNDIAVTNGKEETAEVSAVDTTSECVAKNLAQERNTILDLGCGTGTLTELFARRGYDMIGIDNAQEMLQIALEKRERSGLPILYLLQDMREFELYGTVGAVISVCDSLNYLLEESDIIKTFRLVNNYLYPQSLFIFDFNTVYKYAQVIGDATIAENREDCSFIWENYYHEAEEINEYDLTVFVAEGRNESEAGGTAADAAGKTACGQMDERFRRFQEVHYQRGYCLEQMMDFLVQAGLSFVEAIDADTHGKVTGESERIYVVARKGTETTANQKAER